MSELGIRLVKRSIMVAIVLGGMGYVFAEVFLIFSRMNGGVVNSANDSVRWRTPLTMAGLGVAIQIVLETVMFSIRRKKLASVANATVVDETCTAHPGSSAV